MATFSVNIHRLEFAGRCARLVVTACDVANSAYRLDDEDRSVSVQIVDGPHLGPFRDVEHTEGFLHDVGGSVGFSAGHLHDFGQGYDPESSGRCAVHHDFTHGPLRIATPSQAQNILWINPFDRKCLHVESN